MGRQDKEKENPREGCGSGRLPEAPEGSNPGTGAKLVRLMAHNTLYNKKYAKKYRNVKI